ncbi:MAG: endonuclease [Tannerellaceae bacterium]|jgi:endonuclease/exonuclease/phosphatase family metal-dependent hydrolase|nr:endonuclease [Tannerellaceae bacterium]
MRKAGIAITLFIFLPVFVAGQIPFRVMSYNVENFFDVYDDPETEDDEFLPFGNRIWTPSRYKRKLEHISQVISAAGEWDTPALIGLCEVENDTTLTHLLMRTPLRHQQYRYIVTSGSDRRGINVALLYQRDKFRYIGHSSIKVRFKSAAARPTRDILHVWGEINSGDTLDVMVCHLPSKYGGEKESESNRLDAARILATLSDSLSHIRLSPLQIIMGDFNEEPWSECLNIICGKVVFNLFASIKRTITHGSQKYQGEWSQLDQILIHRRMKSPETSMQFVPGSAGTFSPSFLLVDDNTWHGKRPLRTYHGFRYEAGYSDHLPVIADFIIK